MTDRTPFEQHVRDEWAEATDAEWDQLVRDYGHAAVRSVVCGILAEDAAREKPVRVSPQEREREEAEQEPERWDGMS